MGKVTQRKTRREWTCSVCSATIEKGSKLLVWNEGGMAMAACLGCGPNPEEESEKKEKKVERKKLLKRKTRPRVNKRVCLWYTFEIQGTIREKDAKGYALVDWDSGRTSWANTNYLVALDDWEGKVMKAKSEIKTEKKKAVRRK